MKWTNLDPHWRRRSQLRLCVYLALAVLCLLLSYQLISNHHLPAPASFWVKLPDLSVVQPAETELVLAAMWKSNMSWVHQNLPKWHANIYRADAEAALTVPMNKGNEAMVYLTYVQITPRNELLTF